MQKSRGDKGPDNQSPSGMVDMGIVDLRVLFAELWKGKFLIVLSTVVCLAIGFFYIWDKGQQATNYNAQAIIKVGEYLAQGEIQDVEDVESLVWRFDHLHPIRTRLDKRRPADGLVMINIVAPKEVAAASGEKTFSQLMTYLEQREQQLEQHGVQLISRSEPLKGLTVAPLPQDTNKKLILLTSAMIGLVAGIIFIFIRHAFFNKSVNRS